MAQQPGFSIKIPSTITLRDIVALIAVAISVTVSWGLLGTRLSLAEKELITIQKQRDADNQRVVLLEQRLESTQNRLRDNEMMLEEMWRKSKQ